eukprot:8521682-Pyramimonas_sp.AAC.2
MADLIVEERSKVFEEPDKATIFFSAHGVPKSYVEEGDPYKEEMEECVQLIMAEVKKRGVNNDHVLAYQVGKASFKANIVPSSSRAGNGEGAHAALGTERDLSPRPPE